MHDNQNLKFVAEHEIPKRALVAFTQHLTDRDFINYNNRLFEEAKIEAPHGGNYLAKKEAEKMHYAI